MVGQDERGPLPHVNYTAMLIAKQTPEKGGVSHYQGQGQPLLPTPFPGNKRLIVNHPGIRTKANENVPHPRAFHGPLYTPALSSALFD